MSGKSDFGKLVCETLAMNPDIVRSIVIEVFPESVLTVTLEIPSDSPEVLEWAKTEELKHPGKVVLMEVDEWQFD